MGASRGWRAGAGLWLHGQCFMPFLLPPAAGGWCQLLFWGPAMGNSLQVTMGPLSWLGRGMLSCWLHPDGLCSSCLFCRPPGRASLHDKASLRLEQVRSEDQGWYECKVLMLDQQYDTFHNGSWVHLTINGVYGPPSWGWGTTGKPTL